MEPDNPYSVELISFVENEDGSADIEFVLGPEALKKFASIGILSCLKDSVEEIKNELLHKRDGEI